MKLNDKSFPLRMIGGAILICFASIIANATGSEDIGVFKSWSAHLLVENKTKICYLHGVPDKSAGKYEKRGDTYIQVTHRIRPRSRNEVSITAGYNYKKESAATLTIDGKKFVLFTQADTAWAGEENPDHKLVAAMRRGGYWSCAARRAVELSLPTDIHYWVLPQPINKSTRHAD